MSDRRFGAPWSIPYSFGTFERLHYLRRSDLMRRLLDDVNDYYPHLLEITEERDCTFSRELVTRTANLAAQC